MDTLHHCWLNGRPKWRASLPASSSRSASKKPAVIASIFLIIATSRVEENEYLSDFGEAYREYMKRTKMFVPFILQAP